MHIDGNQLVLSDGRRFRVVSPRNEAGVTQTTKRRPIGSLFRAFIPQAKSAENSGREAQTTQQAS